MLGFAYQMGLVPVSGEAIERAIELNGVAIEFNRRAFRWGRKAAHDPAAVERLAMPPAATARPAPAETLEEIVAVRREQLTAYQDAAYAERYAALVARVQAAEASRAKGLTGWRRRSRATTTSCSPTRTSTRSPASTATAPSAAGWRSSSRATSSCASIWRRRCWRHATRPGT